MYLLTYDHQGPSPWEGCFPSHTASSNVDLASEKTAKLFSDLLSAVIGKLSYSRKYWSAKLFLEESVLI